VQPSPGTSARPATADDEAARARVDRVFVTAHPSESVTSTALRAGEAALQSYMDGMLERRLHLVPESHVAVGPLRRLLAGHLRERLPDDEAGTLHAAVVAAGVVAALDLALTEWLLAGARADGVTACRERFRSVAPLLPPEP
jgi:hypothetical protein